MTDQSSQPQPSGGIALTIDRDAIQRAIDAVLDQMHPDTETLEISRPEDIRELVLLILQAIALPDMDTREALEALIPFDPKTP